MLPVETVVSISETEEVNTVTAAMLGSDLTSNLVELNQKWKEKELNL